MDKGKGLALTPLMAAMGYTIGCGASNVVTVVRDWRSGIKNFDAMLVIIACIFAIGSVSIAVIEAKGEMKKPSVKKIFYAFEAAVSACISIILCACLFTGRVIGDVHEIPTVFAMLGFVLVTAVCVYSLLGSRKNKGSEDTEAKT